MSAAPGRAATAMRAIGVFGVIVGLVLGLVAWQFLGDLDRNLDQSLAIGESASRTLIETIDVAEDVIDSLDQGLLTIDATLGTVESTLSDTAGLADTTASLAATLPESFDDVDAALATVESLGGTIDGALRAASRIPLGPDYDPEVPLPQAVGNLRAAFAPIGDDLQAISVELQVFADGSGDVRTQIDAVRADVGRTRTALGDSAALLDRYRVTAREAGDLAASSRDDMSRAFVLARIATVLLAIFVVVAQYVPFWLAGRAASVSDAVPTGTTDHQRQTDGDGD